jgi:hypothetical protein
MHSLLQEPKALKTLSMDGEQWLKIEGFERYFVSCHGRVYSTVRSGRLLKQTVSNNGYKIVSLMKLGESRAKKHFVHRLVASAFLEQKNLPTVNHIDGDKLNNVIENLEWCTYGHNNEHAKQNGLSNAFGEGHYKAFLTLDQVKEIKRRVEFGEKHKDVASDFCIKRRHVTKIVSGGLWGRALNA